MGKPWQNESLLRDLYVDERMSQAAIADELGCGDSTISNYIREYDIVRPWRDEETMRRLYEEERLSQSGIADRLDISCQTVEKAMDDFDIEGRKNGLAVRLSAHSGDTAEVLSSESELRRLYRDEKLSQETIGDQLNCDGSTVHRALVDHGIERRSKGEAKSLGHFTDETRAILHDPDEMEQLYVRERLSIPEIVRELAGPSLRTVANWLERHGIDRRTIKEAVPTGPDSPNWKGGYMRDYGYNWRTQRNAARERDEHQCVLCPKTEAEHLDEHGEQLHVHHIQPFRTFKPFDMLADYDVANALQNLLSLCRACHHRVEKMAPLRPVAVTV